MAKKTEIKVRCNSCGQELDKKEFPISFSFKDKNTGRLPMCKECCCDLYDRLMLQYHDEVKALYKFCMMTDLFFSKDQVTTLQSKRNSDKNLCFLYISKMGLVQYRNKTFKDTKDIINIFDISEEELEDMLFLSVEKNKEEILKKNKEIITPEIIERWGKDLDIEDYIFLEERYNSMLEYYDDKNIASLWTYQEICFNYLYLRKERGNPKLQKDYQDAISKLQADCKMKLSQIGNDDDENACLGKKIDRIETTEPCERKLPFFDDIDGIGKYIKRWFVQPFCREWGISKGDVLEPDDDIRDYEDINSIYKETSEKYDDN